MNRINAVILDWAGTTVDFGSFAPTQIFVEAFRQAFAVEITLEEARVPMGLGKWQHIEALGKLPAVDARWQAKFGRAMNAADIDAIYAAFMPLQIAKVVDFSAPIAGVVDTIAALRAEGIKIGSCSGYPRPVMEKLAPAAAAQGVCDLLIRNGIKAIWNFEPTHLDVPPQILVQNENMAASLALLCKHLNEQMKSEK